VTVSEFQGQLKEVAKALATGEMDKEGAEAAGVLAVVSAVRVDHDGGIWQQLRYIGVQDGKLVVVHQPDERKITP
jgi:hypothetical protein